MRNSNWTGRVARTLQQAFGPYTDRHVYCTESPPRWHIWAWVCFAAAVTIGAVAALGV